MDYAASKAHFQSLFDRYGRRVQCFNLVRHSPHKEELLGSAFRELCPTVNRIMGPTECYGHSPRDGVARCELCTHLPNGGGEAVSYLEYDFLKNAHTKPNEPSHLFSDLEAHSESFFHKFGFYVDPPSGSNVYLSFPYVSTIAEIGGKFRDARKKDGDQPAKSSICNRASEEDIRMLLAATDIVEESADLDVSQSKLSAQESSTSNIFLLSNGLNSAAEVSSNTYGAGASTGLLQYGTLRTNCVDCLDRTNVAQFCYARVAISRQLKALGFLPTPKALGDMITTCMKLWAEHGDAIATQYGGSGAMHKVDAEEAGGGSTGDSDQSPDTVFVLTGGAKNALVAAQRYYSNIRSDYERQNSIDMLLGVFKPHYKEKHIWELKLRPENIRHGKYGRRSSDISGLLAAGKEIEAETPPNHALAKLQQLSTKHFTDDDEASSGEDDEVGPSRETELRSHIEHHKNEKASVNVIRLAIADKKSIPSDLPSCELTSFDNTLRREYDTLALDKLPFVPFPIIESEWKPSVYWNAEESSEQRPIGSSSSDEQVFKKLEERVYGLYMDYYSGGLIDERKGNFAVVLRSLLESAVEAPLDGLSAPKCQLDQLLSLSAREKELLSSNRVDPKLMHACMLISPALQAQMASAVPISESKTKTIRRTSETPSDERDANDTVRKWEEKQKLKEIFDPFSLYTFPELNEKQPKISAHQSDVAETQEKGEIKPDSAGPVDGIDSAPTVDGGLKQGTTDRQSISGREAKASAATTSSKLKSKWQFWSSDKVKILIFHWSRFIHFIIL